MGGNSGKSREVSEAPGKSDSLPATRQNGLQITGCSARYTQFQIAPSRFAFPTQPSHHHLTTRDPAGLAQSPRTPECRKKYPPPKKNKQTNKIPHPELATKKNKKNENGPKITNFFLGGGNLFVFLGPTRGDGFFFFRNLFRDSGVFGLCTSPAGLQLYGFSRAPVYVGVVDRVLGSLLPP